MKELARLATPDGGSIVLYDWMEAGGSNLSRLNNEGRVIWTAQPYKPPNDCFVAVWWDGERLLATTWSCFQVSVDPNNGTIAMIAFTK